MAQEMCIITIKTSGSFGLRSSSRKNTMGVDNILVVFAAILVFYVLVFVFLRRFNELRSFVKLGRKVYQALPPGDMGWPLIGSSLSLYNIFKSSNDPNTFIDHLISKYISSSPFLVRYALIHMYIRSCDCMC